MNTSLTVPIKSQKISPKWLRMAYIYKMFTDENPKLDFSKEAALAMYLHESNGAPLPDPRTNGYSLGKKSMDITVAAWKEEIPQMGLLVSELQEWGFPDWFLEKVGILHLKPTVKACYWWLSEEALADWIKTKNKEALNDLAKTKKD